MNLGGGSSNLSEERKMPWKACNPMDERLKFIADCWTGEGRAKD